MFQSPYGDFGTLTLTQKRRIARLTKFQSPYGDFGTLTCTEEEFSVQRAVVSVPLRGFWYADSFVYWLKEKKGLLFQSPYGDFGTLTTDIFIANDTLCVMFQSPYGDFGTLTADIGDDVVRKCVEFQSPYGDFGTLTLSLSTRSLTGLTGDFFKPKAFLAFFRYPGEK